MPVLRSPGRVCEQLCRHVWWPGMPSVNASILLGNTFSPPHRMGRAQIVCRTLSLPESCADFSHFSKLVFTNALTKLLDVSEGSEKNNEREERQEKLTSSLLWSDLLY